MSAKRLALEGTDLFYTVEGSGRPVLLIHGWTCDQNDWAAQIPFLLSLSFSVIAFDLRGHGHSTFNHGSAFDIRTLVKDTVGLLSHLGIGDDNKAIIIGHSLGGVIANEIAFQKPEYVAGVVLADPAYQMTADALDQFNKLLQSDFENCPRIVTELWDKANVYPPNTPVWMKPWQRRRTWGTHPHAVAATFNQLAMHLGQSGVQYLKKSKRAGIPRLVTCALNASVKIESKVGIDKAFDSVELLPAGHWHFIVESNRFNSLLHDWLTLRGFV